MRVLVCTVVHDPQDARIRFRQIEALLAAGHEVTYAAPFTAYGRTAPDGVRAVDLARATGRHRLRAVLAARRTLAGLAGSHDVVLLHDPELLLAVMRSATLRRTVVVWDVHEDTAAAVGMRAWVPRLLRRIARAGVRVLETWAEKHVRLLLAEHAYAERFARPHPVVPNSVVVPDHVTTTAQRDESGRLRLVYLGRVTYARGARVLLDLAPLLPGTSCSRSSGLPTTTCGPRSRPRATTVRSSGGASSRTTRRCTAWTVRWPGSRCCAPSRTTRTPVPPSSWSTWRTASR